ncbi:hypothetical protein [Cellulomonas sp. Leaf334]|uniref:hypothetical protein n=1 Tax=Cellulomonas sp. Leaf334 TaxID=1736339 RepID=UPI0006FAF1DD|nr:hypothetical protein [Cellulomonas sp. Leaf334]KQR11924.1 hypothetical protein ASF78_12040 [Cellulomonas sp. Leaf334]
MTDLHPTLSDPASGAHSTPPGVRPLTADELGHLDRARAHLRASGADLTDVHAVGALLHATRTRWAAEPGAPVPQAMVMALGVGVGDLVVALVPGSRWALRTAGAAPTPAVVSLSGEDAALPLADVATRWRTGCTPAWVAEYVVAAAAHLSAPATHDVPTPRVPTRTAPEPRADVAPLPARAATTPATAALPSRAETPLPSRRVAPASVPTAPEPAQLPARAAASAGPAGYFATAGGAFPTPHVVAPAPGPVSSGPSRPAHTSLASAFSRNPVAAAPPPAPPAPAVYRVPADLPHPPSRAAQDIALGVLDQALGMAIASGGPAAPFAVVDGSPTQSHEPRWFEGDPARAQQEARAWVRSTGAARAAVAWFGELPADEAPAVFVEASDAGAPSLVVAHRYSAVSYDEGRTRPARPVGDPLVLGQDVPLL